MVVNSGVCVLWADVVFDLRYDVLVCVAASRLPSFLVFGVWPRFHFDDSESRHELLSESAWPDACTLWARWHIPAETGRLVAAVRLWWMWRRWLTERRSGEQLVCAHTSSHDVTEHYRLPEKSSESESSVWLTAIFLWLCPAWWYKSAFLHQSVLIIDSVCVWCLCVFKGDMCLIFIAYLAFLLHDICMLFIHVATIWLIQSRGEIFQVHLNWKKKEY